MQDISNHPRYREARCHVERLKGFYTHAAVYVLVNLGIFVLAMASSRVHAWFPWSAVAWGIGLAAHAISVFALGGWLGAGWEERKIREYLERVKGIEPSS